MRVDFFFVEDTFKNFILWLFFMDGVQLPKLEPLREGSSLFTIKFPEIPGNHFIDLGRINGWVDLGATQWFWAREPWIGNPAP